MKKSLLSISLLAASLSVSGMAFAGNLISDTVKGTENVGKAAIEGTEKVGKSALDTTGKVGKSALDTTGKVGEDTVQGVDKAVKSL